MVEQGAASAIHGAQRSDLGSVDAEFAAEVAPQRRWHNPNCIKESAAHAQKADMQRQAKLQRVTTAGLDQLALRATESKEGLQLEAAQIAPGCRASPGTGSASLASRAFVGGVDTIRFEKVNSNANQINNLPTDPRTVDGFAYRHLLH